MSVHHRKSSKELQDQFDHLKRKEEELFKNDTNIDSFVKKAFARAFDEPNEEINDLVQSLTDISDLKSYLELQKEIFNKIYALREQRITEINTIIQKIEERNKDILKSEEFQSLLTQFHTKLKDNTEYYRFDQRNVLTESSKKKREELILDFINQMKQLGFVFIDFKNFNIHDFYYNYICSYYGHEFERDKNGKIKSYIKGETSDVYEKAIPWLDDDDTRLGQKRILKSRGNEGIETAYCTLCQKYIVKDVPLDIAELQQNPILILTKSNLYPNKD